MPVKMAKTKTYNHFCPAARALEVIGEKWSLLVVRDLLGGPQRFTDLLRGLRDITPKWLTARLRELEAAGIVEREQEPGRKEVWYRLTPKGQELAPVVSALTIWGIDHAMRPPEPGETIVLPRSLRASATYFNERGYTAPRPVEWEVRTPEGTGRLTFDGARWRTGATGAEPGLVISGSPLAWAEFLAARGRARRASLAGLTLEGSEADIRAFEEVFRIPL
jgi:DNA-binding HxlR family transcriptional regulator